MEKTGIQKDEGSKSSDVPRNSTQLISTSYLSPSADSGRSSSRLRNTKGPVSAAARFLFLEVCRSPTSLCSMTLTGAHENIILYLVPRLSCASLCRRCWWAGESKLPILEQRGLFDRQANTAQTISPINELRPSLSYSLAIKSFIISFTCHFPQSQLEA